MNNQFSRHAIVFVLGLAIGSIGAFTLGNRKARAFYVAMEQRVPQGYLVAESKSTAKGTIIMDLAGSYGTNLGDSLRHYFGGVEAEFIGSVFFSYPSANMPGLGDVFLIRMEFPNGKVQEFVVGNGKFGTILETNEMILSYCQKTPGVMHTTNPPTQPLPA